MPKQPPVIAIVVPCYNEQEVLPLSVPRLLGVITRMAEEGIASADSYIMLANDGSRDKTRDIIAEMHAADPVHVKGLSLSRNRGHQYALLAGLTSVEKRCDAAVSIDADLQDDPDAIIEMVKLFNAGAEIVYGVRSSRKADTAFKRITAHAFYRFQRVMGLETVYDHADYRLMSRRAVGMLLSYGESNLFLRGIVPQIGLKTAVVTYERAARAAGESKYPLAKMLNFSIDGITSFSARPMRYIFFIGLILLLADIAIGIWVLVSHFSGHAISGWSSLMLSIWFLGSLILIALGIIGEYVGKIFIEVKHRPRFFISEELFD